MSKVCFISISFFLATLGSLAAQSPWSKLRSEDTLSLVFVGDVMMHTAQLQYALKPKSDPNNPDSYDFSSYFKYIGERISKADFAVANMEFPIGTPPYSGYPLFSAPASIIAECVKGGIDLFLSANNHIADKGVRGMQSTLESYRKEGVHFTGLYQSREDEERENPFIIELKGMKIAFINFTYDTNGMPVPAPFVVNLRDSLQIKQVIARAKERGAEAIIALPHWGVEYSLKVARVQTEWRDFLFRHGVNIIIGSHPHTIQPVEVNEDSSRVVVYSLGNFISNMSLQNTQMGMLFELKLTRKETINGERPSLKIVSANGEWLWCARAGKLEKNFTIIPAKEFLEKGELFIVQSEYQKLKKTYQILSEEFK